MPQMVDGGAWTARLLRRARLSESVYEIELEKPAGFQFVPGQSISLAVGGEYRDYSIASESSSETLRLVVRRIEGGVVSPALCGAVPGVRFELSGPHGTFTFKASERPAIFVATGVGVAPFLSMVRSGVGLGTGPGVGPDAVRAPERSPSFTVCAFATSCSTETSWRRLRVPIARASPGMPRPGCYHGRVTEWSRDRLTPASRDFYLCGSRQMTRDMIVLIDERFPGSLVYTEIFF